MKERAEVLAERLEEALESANWGFVDQLIELPAPDLAEVIEHLQDPEMQAQVLNHLQEPLAAVILDYLEPSRAEEILDHLSEEKAALLLEQLPSDDAAQIVAALEDEKAESLLNQMDPEDAQEVRELLEYAPNTAGRLMIQQYARLHPSWTVRYALDYLRHIDPDVETMNVLYLVDERGRLVGVCSLRELVTADPDTPLEQIMKPEFISVKTQTDQEEVAQLLSKYDLLALPVLDEVGRMQGIVTIDDMVDVLVSEATEDVLKMSAVDPSHEPYLSLSPWETALKRARWLVILFGAAILTTSVMSRYEKDIEKVSQLAVFIPLLIGMGGNAGAQTTTTITRSLALGELRLRHFWRVLGRELLTGLSVGVLIGGIGYLFALVFLHNMNLAVTVALSQVLIIMWAKTVGATLPMIAKRLNIDPALMSAPFITTFVDATGLVLYFGLAKIIMGI